jgi:hypothetical protein
MARPPEIIGRRGDILDRSRTALAGRLEGRGADGDDLFRILRLHGLDRVAGIDRPLERVWPEHLAHVRHLHHVEQRRHARHDVLAVGRGRRNDCVIGARERDDQRRERLGKRMLVRRAVGEQHFRHGVELCRGVRDRLGVLAGDQNVHLAAHRLRGGERLVGRILQRLVVVLGDEERGHRRVSSRSSVMPALDRGKVSLHRSALIPALPRP